MKILVNVSVPAIAATYDLFVPTTLRIKRIVSMIAKTVEELSRHQYVSSGEECLCSVEKNILLRHNVTLEKYGIENGSHLIMM